MDATDGRAYVSLGKLLMQQRRFEEARELYDDGATATGLFCIAVQQNSVQCQVYPESRNSVLSCFDSL